MLSVFASFRFVSLIMLIAFLLAFMVDSNYSAPIDTSENTRGASGLTKRDSHVGEMTYYTPGLGACGYTNNDNQMVAAVSWKLFNKYTPPSGNPNQNTLCGKKAKVTYKGKTITVKIVDSCGGCKYDDIDLSSKYQNIALFFNSYYIC